MKQALAIGLLAAMLALAAAGARAGTTVSPGAMQMENERGLPAAPGDVADVFEEDVGSSDEDDERRWSRHSSQ